MTGLTNVSEGKGKPNNLTKLKIDKLTKKMKATPITFAQFKTIAADNVSSVIVISPNTGATAKTQNPVLAACIKNAKEKGETVVT